MSNTPEKYLNYLIMGDDDVRGKSQPENQVPGN